MNVITTDQLKTIVCDSGLLERSQFEEVVELSHLHQRSVEDILIERSLITPEYLTELIADHLKISYVQLGQLRSSRSCF